MVVVPAVRGLGVGVWGLELILYGLLLMLYVLGMQIQGCGRTARRACRLWG
jgi:hypothetical protein